MGATKKSPYHHRSRYLTRRLAAHTATLSADSAGARAAMLTQIYHRTPHASLETQLFRQDSERAESAVVDESAEEESVAEQSAESTAAKRRDYPPVKKKLIEL